MAMLSASSLAKLGTCEKDLQTVIQEAIKYFDFTVLYGNRTPAEQMELFKQGRELVNGVWVIKDKSKVVTYKDGTKSLSNHNFLPSKAVDIAPFPIDWKDEKRFVFLAGIILGIARVFKDRGIIQSNIYWGGDWNNNGLSSDESFVDLPHFEIR